jgi:prevent-host-death family protein
MVRTVNISEAKSALSRLMEAVEQGREREIVITRKGRAVAKLVPAGRRLGVAKGGYRTCV